MKDVSCCVHVYNEADAVVRLIRSSLPLARDIGEWVVLDHRSTDGLDAALDEVQPHLTAAGITLTRAHEDRDFSAAHTFADLRTRTVKECRHDLVALMDADFVLGPRFARWLAMGRSHLAHPKSPYHCATYAVPCIWDRLTVDQHGVIREHGRVWVHKQKPRILWRDAVQYRQISQRGRWERLVATDRARPRKLALSPIAPVTQQIVADTVVSVNVKPPERIALRDTMTMFMQDAVSRGQTGDWLANYAAGKVRGQGEYDYHRVTLTGWRLNCPALRMTSGSPVSATEPV